MEANKPQIQEAVNHYIAYFDKLGIEIDLKQLVGRIILDLKGRVDPKIVMKSVELVTGEPIDWTM